MRALLLAAGLGTRLRPITDSIPKCLVPLNGKPLLEYWLDNLSSVGVTQFLINSSYLHEQVEDYVKNSPYKEQISLVYESELLNTAGTLLKNRDFFKNEAFMLVHADNLCFCDFNSFLQSHETRDTKCDITMMIFRTDTPSSCGIVELDKNSIVQKFYEKVQNPPSNLANGAVYICEPNIFTFLDSLKKENIDFSNEVLPKYLGRINTFLNDVYHRDIGTVESYEIAKSDIKKFVNLPI